MTTDPNPRFAIVVSRFNEEVTSGLLRGARAYLSEKSIALRDEDVLSAPGAFEIPLIAQTLAQTGQFDGVICLGCVIKGDTAHFEYISEAASTRSDERLARDGHSADLRHPDHLYRRAGDPPQSR